MLFIKLCSIDHLTKKNLYIFPFILKNKKLKSTLPYEGIIFVTDSGARVTLEVNIERYNVVNPKCRYVQEIARPKNDFVAHKLREVGELLQIGLGPVYLAVSPRGMARRKHVPINHHITATA